MQLSSAVREALAVGDVIYDHEFDSIFPRQIQALSEAQWSPVKAAQVVRSLLQDAGPARFIDLGCGVGKLCLFLALSTELRVTGIERRQSLIRVAKQLCEENAPGKVELICGDILDLDWSRYDIFYLYNPFMEHKCSSLNTNLIDRNIEFGERAYRKYVGGVSDKIAQLKDGQRVITFHGFGGQMPAEMKCLATTKIGNGSIRLWAR